MGFSLAIIDFEVIPGGQPASGLEISTQFSSTHGVTFSLEPEGNPVLAGVGGPTEAFAGPFGGDTTANGVETGEYFLTDDGVLSGLVAQVLRVDYSPPTSAASGEILDIDFDESFVIEAFNGDGELIDSVAIKAGDEKTGDGLATPWAFQRAQPDIVTIRFTGSRDVSGAFGLGFDNFHARRAPIDSEEGLESTTD